MLYIHVSVLVHSFNIHFLSHCQVPDTVQEAGDVNKSKTELSYCPRVR